MLVRWLVRWVVGSLSLVTHTHTHVDLAPQRTLIVPGAVVVAFAGPDFADGIRVCLVSVRVTVRVGVRMRVRVRVWVSIRVRVRSRTRAQATLPVVFSNLLGNCVVGFRVSVRVRVRQVGEGGSRRERISPTFTFKHVRV